MPDTSTVSTDKLKPYLPAIFALAIFLLAYLPVITDLWHTWSNSEDNSHGFLIMPIFIYMLWQKRETLVDLPLRGSFLGGVMFFLSLCLYVFAKAGGILTLISVSMWASFVSGIWFLFGPVILRSIAFPLFFLLFMFPVPAQIYAAVTGPLQLFVSQAASFFLKASSVPIICQGNVIEHPQQTFQVVQACSGLRSIMTLLTLGAIVGYFGFKKYWLRALLILTAIPVAIIVNILRVYILVGFYDWLQLDLTEGPAHTLLGVGVFVFSLGLFFLVYKVGTKWDR